MKTKIAVGILFLFILFAGARSIWAYDYQMDQLIDGVNKIGDGVRNRNYIEQDKTRIMRERNRIARERNRIEQQRVKNEMDEAHRRNFFQQIETFFPDWRELYNHRFWNVVLENNSGLFNPFYLHEKKNAFGRVLSRTVVRSSPALAIELLRDIYKMEEKRLEMVNGNHDPKIMLEMAHFFGGYDIKWKKMRMFVRSVVLSIWRSMQEQKFLKKICVG